MTIKAKCSVCGKETELEDNLASFVEKYPDRVKCKECYAKGGSDAKKATAAAKGSGKSAETSGKNKVTVDAELLRKSYDEVKAAFADVIDEVHEFIGGWTTTVALSKTK